MSNETKLPQVPLTMEGSYVLHQMFRVRHASWNALSSASKLEALHEITEKSASMAQTSMYAMLGHKAELMFVHFRNSLDELHSAQTTINTLKIAEHMDLTTSYLSVVELGLYESSVKTYRELIAKGLAPGTAEWDKALAEVVQRQREAMKTRLYPEIPPAKYICFYPMDRRRGEHKNWYMLPIEERQRQMHEHGLVGRRYGGEVKQIITGSIGYDDWEWGVDLFAEDSLVFKKLIYEMRFDEVSAMYAHFGTFYVGIRILPENIGKTLMGE
jgi:peroxiredoxin